MVRPGHRRGSIAPLPAGAVGAYASAMTCRVACAPPASEGIAAVYAELAEAGRWEDFRWLAESQGLARERIDLLWAGLLARCRPGALIERSHR